jgi:cyclic pyranopterin phosphate synthase
MGELTHFDRDGNAIMVDVSEKSVTSRIAVAQGSIRVNAKIMTAIVGQTVEKGDVLGVARVAGIMAVKQTSALIPMCHPLAISKCGIDYEIDQDNHVITAICTVKVEGKTGVEMEALTGASIALLTIYDMCKAIDKQMELTSIHLVNKTGGKSGEFHWDGGR